MEIRFSFSLSFSFASTDEISVCLGIRNYQECEMVGFKTANSRVLLPLSLSEIDYQEFCFGLF